MSQSSGPHRQPSPVTHLDDRRAAPKILGAIQLVRKYSKATGSARAVLNVLATYCEADGTGAHPGTKTLATQTGLSVDTVKRARKRLVALGEVEIIRLGTGSTSTRYRLRLVYLATPGGVQAAPQPDRDRTNTGGPTPPRCSRHVGVAEPPPCRGCRTEREAADAAAFAAAAARHQASAANARSEAARERAERSAPETRARGLATLRDCTRIGTLPQDEPKG